MSHKFHIPVMGIAFTLDTPIRIAHLGISSVISLVDDLLMEKVRKHYCGLYGFAYEKISEKNPAGRAKRVTAYLNMVDDIVQINMERTKREPFFQKNDKCKYFELLPSDSLLKQDYIKLNEMPSGEARDRLAAELTERMQPGAIDVNIMVKIDRKRYDKNGDPLSDDESDARTALKGFAESTLQSGLVFSAGINKGLFRYMTNFKGFYRNSAGDLQKRIILKVSDFRSSVIQGKFLAQMGLEVAEYRIESGLNCGGHAFPSNGTLLPWILREFKANRHKLVSGFHKLVIAYYEKKGWDYRGPAEAPKPLITVQGGIGAHGEAKRLLEDFGMDRTGWGTPFLLVPEAVCVDSEMSHLLKASKQEDLFLSNVSPLSVPFNLVRNTTSEKWTLDRVEAGNAGSPCPKKFLSSNTEFSEKPICLAAHVYQSKKLDQVQKRPELVEKKQQLKSAVVEKVCLCEHLGNSALINLGISTSKKLPTIVCPGPNLAWFDRTYTLREMVDYIYGRGPCLVSADRPHMFAMELVMYVDYFEKLAKQFTGEAKSFKNLQDFVANLEKSMDFCLEISAQTPYADENLASIAPCVVKQRHRLNDIWESIERQQQEKVADDLPDNFQEVDARATKIIGRMT